MKNHLYFIGFLTAGFLSLASCSKRSDHELKVAATSVPHAEILELIKPDLQEQNIDLNIIVVEDYNTPNRALQDKEVDANFFQHLPFLEAQMHDFGYQLEPLVGIHLEPMALYSKKIKSLKELQPGATLALPSDPSNQARALALLQQLGLIQLNQVNAKSSLLDIADNPHGYRFVEMDSPLLSRALDDVDLAAITTNFALQAGLSPQQEALAIEDAKSPFVNYVVIRKGEAGRQDLQALKAAMTADKVKAFIEKQYREAVVPAF